MTATIDLQIPGNPSSIYALADWLSGTVAVSANDLKDRLKKTGGDSSEFWEGRTGNGFRESAGGIADAVDPVHIYASDAAEVFRAYARRLERGREEFDGYLDEASASVLIVSGEMIAQPMPAKTYITAPGQPTPIEHGPGGESIVPVSGEEREAAVKLYERIAEQVGTWWGELENWINEQIVPLMARVTDFDLLNATFETLKKGNEIVRGFPLALASLAWEERLHVFQGEAKTAQEAAASFDKKLRSNNPAVYKPLLKTSKAELQATAEVLADYVKGLKVGTKIVIPGSGLVIDIVATSADVANGGSVSSGVVGVIGGLGGSAAGGAGVAGLAALGVEIPPLGVALIVAAIAVGAGELSTWIYESNVPLDIREALDAGDYGYVFK